MLVQTLGSIYNIKPQARLNENPDDTAASFLQEKAVLAACVHFVDSLCANEFVELDWILLL